MALYFFNLAGAVYDPDVKGVKLRSIGKARVMAALHAAEILRDLPRIVWEGEELRVEVTDSDQQVLFTVVILGIDHTAAEKD